MHAAGWAHDFKPSAASAERMNRLHIEGTRNVVAAAAESGVGAIVHISSVAVYGRAKSGICSELTAPDPDGSYAESKLGAEGEATIVAARWRMPLTILRLTTLYGEGDPGNLARLMRAIDRRRFLWIGDGSNVKCLLHVEDAARAVLGVVRRPEAGSQIFNVSAPPCPMREVIEHVALSLGRSVPPMFLGRPAALSAVKWATRVAGGCPSLRPMTRTLEKFLASDRVSGEAFERAYGFEAQIPLREGLRREAEWYRRSLGREPAPKDPEPR